MDKDSLERKDRRDRAPCTRPPHCDGRRLEANALVIGIAVASSILMAFLAQLKSGLGGASAARRSSRAERAARSVPVCRGYSLLASLPAGVGDGRTLSLPCFPNEQGHPELSLGIKRLRAGPKCFYDPPEGQPRSDSLCGEGVGNNEYEVLVGRVEYVILVQKEGRVRVVEGNVSVGGVGDLHPHGEVCRIDDDSRRELGAQELTGLAVAGRP